MSIYINKEIVKLFNLKNNPIKKLFNRLGSKLLTNEKPYKGFFYPKERQEFINKVESYKNIDLMF